MADYIEVDFLKVETEKSGDAISLRYSVGGNVCVHVVDGGYVDTGDQVIEHVGKFYGTTTINHVVLTHPDQDHANGLRKVLEECDVRRLWMHRPWLYAAELISRFKTYSSVDALERKLRSAYAAADALEEIALRRGIPISEPFQGAAIGAFTVLAPTKARYLDLVVASDKTPEPTTKGGLLAEAADGLFKLAKSAGALIRALWGEEYFPAEGTSTENEMSVVQYATINDKRVLLTGDAGRDGLAEAADYAVAIGLTLPGVWAFQVPHHGGRHNVNTEILDRWLGPKLSAQPEKTSWNAVCSAAKADADHPRNAVIRAMLHRGAHFSTTEGATVNVSSGITRDGWKAIPQASYPETQEQ